MLSIIVLKPWYNSHDHSKPKAAATYITCDFSSNEYETRSIADMLDARKPLSFTISLVGLPVTEQNDNL